MASTSLGAFLLRAVTIFGVCFGLVLTILKRSIGLISSDSLSASSLCVIWMIGLRPTLLFSACSLTLFLAPGGRPGRPVGFRRASAIQFSESPKPVCKTNIQ